MKANSKKKLFYDVHCHALNLSHPGLTIFINRAVKEFSVLKVLKIKHIPIVIIALLSFVVFLNLFLFYMNPQNPHIIKLLLLILYAVIIYYVIKGLIIILLKERNFFNILSLMENNPGNYFLLIERDILNSSFFTNSEYNKCILTPLVIDFGEYSSVIPGTHYNTQPLTAMREQVEDLFNGIYRYNKESKDHLLEIYPFMGINPQNYPFKKGDQWACVTLTKKICPLPQKYKNKIIYDKDSQRLIAKVKIKNKSNNIKNNNNNENDIYFDDLIKHAGNGNHEAIKRLYDNSKNINDKEGVVDLLDKYFKKFKSDYGTFSRHYSQHFPVKKGRTNKNIYTHDIDDIEDFYFAGIKLYPPTGFDPWPEGNQYELKKVKLLYETCSEKKIPITVHCSMGGFQIIPKKLLKKYADPQRWKNVICKYPDLKINFAHMGIEKKWWPFRCCNILKNYKLEWFKTILNYMELNDNIYMDFSNKGFDKHFYTFLDKLIKKYIEDEETRKLVKERILFGSDLMVNLFNGPSYTAYLNEAKGVHGQYPEFFSTNPGRFLFEK